MPRPRPPHLHREVSRHGRVAWYVRVGKGLRIRLKTEFGTQEFDAEYRAALAGEAPAPKADAASGTLAWLITRYREVEAWSSLSPATRLQREQIFRQVIASAGREQFARITADVIAAGRDRRAKTPFQARHFLETMRGLFKWAHSAKLVKADPTVGVSKPPHKLGEGFPAWTEEHVAAYERRWLIGTRQRVWLDVLLYTGLRRGDAVRLGRQHVKAGLGSIKTEKSGFAVMVTLPILPVLARTLEAGPCGDLTFIAGANGAPLTKGSFGNLFREACRAAGIPGSAHGVRKIAATTAANNGATVSQLKALFGWTSDAMPSLYTRTADRERLGRESGHMLENVKRTSIPAPPDQVRAPSSKR
jgi:integrase